MPTPRHRSGLAWCVWLTGFALFLSGCNLAPKPEPQEAVEAIATANAYSMIELDGSGLPSQPTAWWEGIVGPELTPQITRLVEDNFDLREARERLLQTEQRARQARAGQLPVISADAGASRSRTTTPAGTSSWNETFSAGLAATFDTDIFGGLRSNSRAARLSAEAARLNYVATEHQVIAAFVRNWVTAVSLERRVELARTTAESFATTFRLTDERYRAGSSNTSATDVQIARQNLTAALADIPGLETQLTAQLLVIDQQLAQMPGTLANTFAGSFFTGDEMQVPLGMPAQLLSSRPDIAAAELLYRAALQDIGAARANLLPGLSLSGSLSFQNAEPSDLFNAEDYIASLIASLTQPVFQGGRLRAQLKVEESEARELATAYARTALNALSEVETALAQQAGLLRELEKQRENLEIAEISNELAQNRYRQGLQPLLTVLETQRSLNNAQLSVILTEQSLAEARINLHLSLGGRWFDADPSPETESP
jgi:NodT family efflux transporter outer membrane factor (OMF) lipoprotein